MYVLNNFSRPQDRLLRNHPLLLLTMKRVLFAALSFGAALLACASAIPDTVPNRGLSSGTDNFGNNHLFKRAPTRVGCTCEDLNYLIGGKDQGVSLDVVLYTQQ